MKLKRIFAFLTASAMLAALCPSALAADGAKPLTRGEVREILVAAADDYNPGVTPDDVLRGDPSGNLDLDRTATWGETLLMFSRAFGVLPTPVGDSARWTYAEPNVAGVPNWAAQELGNVFQSGIIAGLDWSDFTSDAVVTQEDVDVLLHRAYALEASNLKDDFYAAVNKEWLDSSEIPAGMLYSGTLSDMSYLTNLQIAQLIGEIVSSETVEPGTPQEKIKNLYENIMNWDERNQVGVQPLQPYLDAIDEVSSLDELLELHNRMIEELSAATLLGFSITIDPRDSNQYMLTFVFPSPSLTKEAYSGESDLTAAFRQYMVTLLTLGGETEENAAAQTEAMYEMEKDLASSMMDAQDYSDLSKILNLYSIDDVKAMLPGIDLDAVCAAFGFPEVEEIVVSDPGLLEKAASYLNEEHLDLLKIAMKLSLLSSFGSTLSHDFLDAAMAFQNVQFGMDVSVPDEMLAAQLVQNYLADYLGEAYVERYFSAEAKADVENMIDEFKIVYKDRIENLDWMSETTKEQALQKLDTMTVKVGYPDTWNSYLDDADISSAAEGGSYFENLISISKTAWEYNVRAYQSPVDKTLWQMPAYTANAYYDPTSNSINFPAGILQAPLYDVDADPTENLGGIGYVIAHEMTHAFDNNGAKYDINGNMSDWWTPEDYEAFEGLCADVVEFYDGLEFAPDLVCNGTQTLSENIADLGAIACITQVEGMEEEPDYETLYESAARTWRCSANRETLTYLNQIDAHARDKIRGSRVLQSCDEFYTAFDIQPGDGMWVDPEARVRIW